VTCLRTQLPHLPVRVRAAGLCADLHDSVWRALQRRLDLQLAPLPSLSSPKVHGVHRGASLGRWVTANEGEADQGEAHDEEAEHVGGAADGEGAGVALYMAHSHDPSPRGEGSHDVGATMAQHAHEWENLYGFMDAMHVGDDVDSVHGVHGMNGGDGVHAVEQSVSHQMTWAMQDTEQDTEQFHMELEELADVPRTQEETVALGPDAEGENTPHMSGQVAMPLPGQTALPSELPCCPPSAIRQEEQVYRVLARDADENEDENILSLAGCKGNKKKGRQRERAKSSSGLPSSPAFTPDTALVPNPAPRGAGWGKAGANGTGDVAQLSPPVQSLAQIQQREEAEARSQRQSGGGAAAKSFPGTWGGGRTGFGSVGNGSPALTEARAPDVVTDTRVGDSKGINCCLPAPRSSLPSTSASTEEQGDVDLFWGAAVAGATAAAHQGAAAPRQGTSKTSPGGAPSFSLLDFAPAGKASRKSKAGRQQVPQEHGAAVNPLTAWQSGGFPHVSPAAPALAAPHSPPSVLLLQPCLAAIQAEQEGGKQGRRRGSVKKHISADHAWRNELNAAPAPSVDEIQRRELWEAEEREALDLIRAYEAVAKSEEAALARAKRASMSKSKHQ